MASANIILHSAGGNIARPTKFDIIITFPTDLDTSVSGQVWNTLVKTITIPTTKMETLEYKYKGHTIPIPGRSQPDYVLPVSFLLDENYQLNTALLQWLEAMDKYFNSSTQAIEDLRDNLYKPTGEIKVIGKTWDNASIIEYSFENVYPISVSGTEYSTESVGSLLDFSVEFSFTQFYTTNLPDKIGPIEGFVNDSINKVTGYVNDQKDKLLNSLNDSDISKSVSSGIDKTNDFFKSL